MKMYYTVTTTSCPHCHAVLSRHNDGWIHVLIMLLLPLVLVIFPFSISVVVLQKLFQIEALPPVGKPKIKACPKCGKQVKMREAYSYNDLKPEYKRQYDYRWLFIFAYIIGGFFIVSLLLTFSFISEHPTDRLVGTVGACLAPVFFIVVAGIVVWWRRSQKLFTEKISAKPARPAQQNTGKPSGGNSAAIRELIEYKELLDRGIITRQEFEAKKKQILDL